MSLGCFLPKLPGRGFGGLTQAYFLDMFLIYKDPKSSEKLSFSLEFFP